MRGFKFALKRGVSSQRNVSSSQKKIFQTAQRQGRNFHFPTTLHKHTVLVFHCWALSCLMRGLRIQICGRKLSFICYKPFLSGRRQWLRTLQDQNCAYNLAQEDHMLLDQTAGKCSCTMSPTKRGKDKGEAVGCVCCSPHNSLLLC